MDECKSGRTINQVILEGELVKDAAFIYSAGKTPLATFTLAFYSHPDKKIFARKNKGRIDVIFWGAGASVWGPRLKKGAIVVVKGCLQQRNWKTPEGIERAKTEIIATQIDCKEHQSEVKTGSSK